LQLLHDSVKQNRIDVKQQHKKQYDKRRSASESGFKIGDAVLLFDKRIKPHSNFVLTHKNFNSGPFYIADIVEGKDIGKAYKLIHEESGKSYKNLVPADRLKIFRVRANILPTHIMFGSTTEKPNVPFWNIPPYNETLRRVVPIELIMLICFLTFVLLVIIYVFVKNKKKIRGSYCVNLGIGESCGKYRVDSSSA